MRSLLSRVSFARARSRRKGESRLTAAKAGEPGPLDGERHTTSSAGIVALLVSHLHLKPKRFALERSVTAAFDDVAIEQRCVALEEALHPTSKLL